MDIEGVWYSILVLGSVLSKICVGENILHSPAWFDKMAKIWGSPNPSSNSKNILLIFCCFFFFQKIFYEGQTASSLLLSTEVAPLLGRVFPFSVLLFKSFFLQFSFFFPFLWDAEPRSRCHWDKPLFDMIGMKFGENVRYKLMICIILDHCEGEK